MKHAAIMSVEDGKCAKYDDFDTRAEAEEHIAKHRGTCPDAYVVPMPDFRPWRWVCDPVAKTVTDRGPETKHEIALRSPLKTWRFHAMLDLLGKTNAVRDAVEAMEDPKAKAKARAKLANPEGGVFDRCDQLFKDLAPAVGLTDDQIDDAWVDAMEL